MAASTESLSEAVSERSSTKAPSESIFSNRTSLLDVKTVIVESREAINLAGFYHLYWIALGIFVLSTFLINWVENGYLLGGAVAQCCFSDPWGVVAGELLMASSTLASGLCIFCPLGRFSVLRLFLPLATLVIGVLFGFQRGWSGLQRAIFLLHSLAVIMKIYAFIRYHYGRTVRRKHFREKTIKYIHFLFAPTLVYSDAFPLNVRIRKRILLERATGIALCGVAMYIVVENYIFPPLLTISTLRHLVTRETNPRFVSHVLMQVVLAYARLLLPCSAFFLLFFFFVFEYWCNLFAELTRFADRQFYTDWWNGISFYDFSTRWNVPVHRFLQKHVYRELLDTFHRSVGTARFLTFLVSSLFHELVMFIMMGPSKYTFSFVFLFQMLQLPLISVVVGSGWARRNVNLANWLFWILLVIGLPSIAISYSITA